MTTFPWFSPTFTRLLVKALVLVFCLYGGILIAEGCVKRPNWEPTPGVAPKGLEFKNILY